MLAWEQWLLRAWARRIPRSRDPNFGPARGTSHPRMRRASAALGSAHSALGGANPDPFGKQRITTRFDAEKSHSDAPGDGHVANQARGTGEQRAAFVAVRL